MYHLGKYLRQRYDEYLGSVYEFKSVFSLSSNYARTMMSLQLVLAGLYPPAPIQMWHENLNWQPIPTSYLEFKEDALFIPYRCER